MHKDLNGLLWEYYALSVAHKAISSQMPAQGDDPDKATFGCSLDDLPEPERLAVLAWMQKHGGSFEGVPTLAAIEEYLVVIGDSIRDRLYQGKTDVLLDDAASYRQFLEKLRRLFEESDSLADYLEVDAYTELPEILRRAKKLPPLVIGRVVPDGLRRRYREASKSYLFGIRVASCALCRAILELALKEAWERRLPGMVNPDRFTLTELWQKLPGLPENVFPLCRTIKENGDRAVHGDAVLSSEQALESLIATQRVLEVLYFAS